MKATVLIANHNYAHYLLNAIDSFFKQTYPYKQLCVVDDCSDDNSWKLLNDRLMSAGTPREDITSNGIEVKQLIQNNIKVVIAKLPKTSGPSTARNIGIELTKHDTDVYAILDADDIMHDTKLSVCMPYFQQPEVGVVYADYQIWNVDTNNFIAEYKEPFNRERLYNECIVHSGALIRKQALFDVLEPTGYYDHNMRTCEDYDLWMRISEKYMICHVPQILTTVRTHNNNSTNSVQKEIWQRNWQRIVDKTNERHNRR